MKNVLITGSNSFIGTNFEKWLKKYPDKYNVETIDMKNKTWKDKDFSRFDVVFHVAGIAHVSSNHKLRDLYYSVNRDLAIETARKAKAEGVKQFIFMSSIIVYGSRRYNKVISKDTIPKPVDYYGDSKFQAELGIRSLENDYFKTVIIRTPMVYGKGAKGNYLKLSRIAKILPIFPDYDNQRSMIHIDNLCEFIRCIIDYEKSGLFFPQNKEYVKTSEMVKLIASAHGKKIKLVKVFNPLIKMISPIGIVNKIFGDLVYEKSMSEYEFNYRIREFKESIIITELESECN